jgi:hypothetical protein
LQPSAELRWFWPNTLPTEVQAWYFAAETVGGGGLRRDEYFIGSGHSELGIKRRDVRPENPTPLIEIKGLVDVIKPGLELRSGNAGLELWSKWACSGIDFSAGNSLYLNKRRWLRKFSISGQIITEVPLDIMEKPLDANVVLPFEGCNVELTKVALDGSAETEWFTFGLEAFGPLHSVLHNLRQTSQHLKIGSLSDLSPEHQMSYPAWLKLVTKQ